IAEIPFREITSGGETLQTQGGSLPTGGPNKKTITERTKSAVAISPSSSNLTNTSSQHALSLLLHHIPASPLAVFPFGGSGIH
ncbi:hypothetical protein JOQ06_017920, partial [Pogonophryne albipinna]